MRTISSELTWERRMKIAKVWGSFDWYDEPRSYYDPVKKDVFFYGDDKKKGRPAKTSAKKSKKK